MSIQEKYLLELTDMPGEHPVYFNGDFFFEIYPNGYVRIFNDSREIHTTTFVLEEFSVEFINKLLLL
jgi:hypothetical protein